MNTKKILSLMAASVLTLSLLSGCGKADEATETTAPATTTVAAETTAAPVEAKTYTAKAEKPDERGWQAEVTVTYEGDKIVKVEYDEVNKDGAKKSADENYAKMMKDKTKVSPAEAYAQLTEAALKEDKAITVTGATVASKEFETLYAQAKAMKK